MRKMMVFVCIVLMVLFFSVRVEAGDSPEVDVFVDDYNSNSVIYSLEVDIPTDSHIFKDVRVQVNGTGFDNFTLSKPRIININSSDRILSLWNLISSKIYDGDKDGLVHVAGVVSVQYRTCTDSSFLYCSDLHLLKLNYSKDILLPVEFSNKKITFAVMGNRTIYEGENSTVRIILDNANPISALIHYQFDAAIGNGYGSISKRGKILIPPHSERELMFKVWHPESGTYAYSIDLLASRVGESELWSVGSQNDYVVVLKKPHPVTKLQTSSKIVIFHYKFIFPH